MPIYSYEGTSIQIIDESTKPSKPSALPVYDDEGNKTGEMPSIQMKNQRPSPEHIANTKGEWVLPEPHVEVTHHETDTTNAP